MVKSRGKFGGTAGLWLLRKKHRAAPEMTEVSTATTTKTGTNSEEALVLGPKDDATATAATSKSQRISSNSIGWDEERCRPIYNGGGGSSDDPSTASSSITTQPSSSIHSDDDDNESVLLGSSVKKPARNHEYQDKLSPPRRKKGVFGGRKRTFVPVTERRDSLSSFDDAEEEVDDADESLKPDSNSSNNPQKNKRICVSSSPDLKDDNDSDDEPKLSSQGSADVFDFEQNEKAEHEAKIAVVVSTKQRQPQPGHRTSLDVARAFFAKIDADQSLLTLSASPTPDRRRRKVRTTRGRLSAKVANAEYQNYCQACRDSNVKPLPMRDFLTQRSEFFRAGEVFDGMFDE